MHPNWGVMLHYWELPREQPRSRTVQVDSVADPGGRDLHVYFGAGSKSLCKSDIRPRQPLAAAHGHGTITPLRVRFSDGLICGHSQAKRSSKKLARKSIVRN